MPLAVYVGGGLDIGVSLASDDPDTEAVEGTGIGFGVRALVGAEYMITDQLGVYGELRGGVGINPLFRPAGFVGINYHF